MIDREIVISSLQEIPTETRVKAWIFEIDKKFYHIASYNRYRLPDACAIWDSNKRGKRLSSQPIFSINGKDHIKCLSEFMDKLDLDSIDNGAE